MKMANIILVITATLTALVAGLFFAWSVSITLGLARVSDSEYVSVMQSINRAIQNPVFFAAFFVRIYFFADLSFFVLRTNFAVPASSCRNGNLHDRRDGRDDFWECSFE